MTKIPSPKYDELHRITTTAIIYNDEGKFLIVKRSPDKKVLPNRWVVPGGGLEVSDYIETKPDNEDQWYYSSEKALRREIKEETALEIKELKYLLDLTFIRPDGIPVIVLSYFAEHKSGEVQLDDDHTDFAWIGIDELDKYDIIEGIKDEIKMVDKKLANN